MLEQLRQNSRSFIIWILFGIIILAFVFTFGSQGGLQFEGCTGPSSSFIMTVRGGEVSENSWRFGRTMLREGNTDQERTQIVMDGLLAREILADEATDAGFRVSSDLVVEEYLGKGKYWVLGRERDLLAYPELGQTEFMKPAYDNSASPPRRVWMLDTRLLEGYVSNYGLPSTEAFIDEQRREILAEMMRRTLRASATGSMDEARLLFEYQNTTATINAVVFRPFDYRSKLSYTDADVAAYAAGHEQQIKDKYESTSKERKPQIRIRQIVINKDADEPAKEKPADGASDAATDSTPAVATGRAAADAAHQRLQRGEDFATVAMEVSQDDRTKRKGGDRGWTSIESPGLGASELTARVQTLEPGTFSEVIETNTGFHILRVEAKREGGVLTFDQMKLELAEPMMVEDYAKALAQADARAALAQAQAGQKLEDLFEKAPSSTPGQLPPEFWQQLQQMSPEDQRRILQQLNGQGSVTFESRSMPAQSAAEPAPAQSAEPAIDAGDDTAAAAATTATDTTAGDATAGAVPIARPADVPKPKLQTVGPFPRDVDGEIQGIGESTELMDLVFDQLGPNELAPKVFEVGNAFVVVQLVERKNAVPEEFDEATKAKLMREIANDRGFQVVQDWLRERCLSLANDGKIGINNTRLSELLGQQDQPFQYRACKHLQ